MGRDGRERALHWVARRAPVQSRVTTAGAEPVLADWR